MTRTSPRPAGGVHSSALAFALALAAFGMAGCDGEDAAPTIPAPEPPAPAPPPEDPAPPPLRAEEVADRETLRQFVEGAANEAASRISDPADAYAFFDATFRPEGPWRMGEIYLFVSETDGAVLFHAARQELEGQDLSDLEDAEGVRITEELLAAAAAGGGYVEYLWDNPALEGDEATGSPKVSYAAPLALGSRELAIGSGIYPPVTAADVRNRGTLKAFVERAAEALAAAASDLDAAYAFLDATFRPDGEWRHDEIYVFVLRMDGINFFQAPDPSIEGVDRSQAEDLNGVKIVQELLRAGEAGGGFVEYYWDNPAIEGDEEHGSPKLAYAIPVDVGATPLVIGSGIYVAEPAQ